ncbi:MAG: hypothetical protein HY901_27765, partial [Deltaproteobacteria bacterium]|nr:hypothetical protein [Deltaproteobacteria bacterium]
VQGGVASHQAITSFDQALWDDLVEGSGAQVVAGRGGVVGQVFDCSPSPGRVQGATVALSTPSRAWYSYPQVVGVDPQATSTSDTGRFFFFDVPALKTDLVADLGGTRVSVPVRTKPGAVTMLQLLPRGR